MTTPFRKGEPMGTKKERKQINIRLEKELHDFLAQYAQENYKTVTAVVREMIVKLCKEEAARKQAATSPPAD